MPLIIAFAVGFLLYVVFQCIKNVSMKILDRKSAEIFTQYIKNVRDLKLSECYLYKGDSIVCDHLFAIDDKNEILCFISYKNGVFNEKRYPFSSLLSSRVHESDTELSVVASFNDIDAPSQIIVLQRTVIGKLDKSDKAYFESRKTAEKINALLNAIIAKNRQV